MTCPQDIRITTRLGVQVGPFFRGTLKQLILDECYKRSLPVHVERHRGIFATMYIFQVNGCPYDIREFITWMDALEEFHGRRDPK